MYLTDSTTINLFAGRWPCHEFIRYDGLARGLHSSFDRGGCDSDTEFFRFTLVTLSPSLSFARDKHDDRGDVGVAPSTTQRRADFLLREKRRAEEREGETRGSEIDLRVIGNPSAVNLGEISVDEFPARFVAFPAGRGGKKNFCVDDVYPLFGAQI